MAAKRPVWYTCTIRHEKIVNFVTEQLYWTLYDDLGLFQRSRFPRRELFEVIDESVDDLQYLASTKWSLSALVGGRSCICVCVCHCTSY